MSKKKYAPPSPDLSETEIDSLMQAPLSDDEVAAIFQPEPEPEIEYISIGELLLLSVESRIGRIADALESVVKIKTAGRNDIVGLTAQVERLADAFEVMAGFVGCMTENVEGQDGVARCFVRTRAASLSELSYRDDTSEG